LFYANFLHKYGSPYARHGLPGPEKPETGHFRGFSPIVWNSGKTFLAYFRHFTRKPGFSALSPSRRDYLRAAEAGAYFMAILCNCYFVSKAVRPL
jgi:hypothetical protein